MLHRVTPPAPLLPLAEAKQWLRVDHDAEDDLIASLTAAATAAFDGPDGLLARLLGEQEWELVLDAFPSAEIHLPIGPVTEVVSVTYVGADGLEASVPAEAYAADVMPVFDGWVVPTETWPAPMATINAVRVRFKGGGDAPLPVRMAILATVAAWYDNRATGEIPPGAIALASTYSRLVI